MIAVGVASPSAQGQEITSTAIPDASAKLKVCPRSSHPGGLEIIELEDSFQLCTRKEYYDTLIKVAKQPKKYVLTDVQLEVLSIIAYKQPVTRQEVEKIRGVNSDHALNRLVEYGLVGEAGRLDAPGRR